jgi:hypothetical protein
MVEYKIEGLGAFAAFDSVLQQEKAYKGKGVCDFLFKSSP